MKLNEYQEASKRTMPKPEKVMSMVLRKSDLYSKDAKANYAMGLSGEAGETTDLIKKELFHGHAAEVKKVKKELGDVLHYVAGLATMYGLTLEEVAIGNLEKLMERYPDGFSKERSVNRVE